ncbi:ABC-2 transporter permease [Paenibacillus arenilitoris]|uniref:ABC-2 transporter permease n=1 Tax=Paenibacillus arenilitoris TaxID=2772299 RepID=A0A927CTB2_9BACL|nr:ABC-2 transporter permease [Paenibacillus arenilitoris]MBD2871851.1 ABC-2 transporter permease [Paenibacillus arenilitoris]
MIQLLMKDIRIQKRFIALGFVFVGFFFFILGAFEGMPLSVPAAIFGHFLIVVASKADEKNNNGRMLASFPLRRTDIVTAKYAGIAMFMAIAFALTSLWRWLAGIFLPARELPWFSAQSIVVTLLILLVFYAIYFPVFFAAGSRLVQVLDLIVIFVVGGAALLVIRLLEWTNIGVGSFIRSLPEADGLPLSLWMLGGGLVLLLLSWCLSVYVYRSKNL